MARDAPTGGASRVSGRTFYVDPVEGTDGNDGMSPNHPVPTHEDQNISPGDSVLFKRGRIVRGKLRTRNGSPASPVTYGAYGEGPRPVFLGSVSVDDPDDWVEERNSRWRYTGDLPSEACNLIFEDGEACGVLRWHVDDLRDAGDWHYSKIGSASAEDDADGGGGELYLHSPDQPAAVYSDIECALWEERELVDGQRHVRIQDLSFRNGGVHGYQEHNAHDVTIRRCEFRCIGGAVFRLDHRVRFGNGVELWNGAKDVTVEGSLFENIYDAGVTHQGGGTHNVPERITFRHNLFIDCGLAAYECREPSKEVYFEQNTCIRSGGGFHMQGEEPPRRSAISVRVEDDELVEMVEWPARDELEHDDLEPIDVGHHVLVWRIDRGTQPGDVHLRKNIFVETPHGAAIYAIVHPADLAKFQLDENAYWQTTGHLLAYMSGRGYAVDAFEQYRGEWEQDHNSRIVRPEFVDEDTGDYRQPETSPTRTLGAANEAVGRFTRSE